MTGYGKAQSSAIRQTARGPVIPPFNPGSALPGGRFPTCLPQATDILPINHGGAEVRHVSAMAKGRSGRRPTHSDPVVIYGQEVRYAARGQDARSRPAQAGIQESGDAVIHRLPVCRMAR